MERLTYRDNTGEWAVACTRFFNYKRFPKKVNGEAIDRLAAYEDTGLEPQEIKDILELFHSYRHICGETPPDRLRELVEADREGRCVVLPAKTVFELTWDAGPDCDMICPLTIDGEGQCDFCDKGEMFIYERKCRQEHIDCIGKTVFLTREAAEAALKGERYEK